jgi:hypothetical protein
MKFGRLEPSTVEVNGHGFIAMPSGSTDDRESTVVGDRSPTSGQIRYNTDINVGGGSTGALEVYQDGEWTPLVSLLDLVTNSSDLEFVDPNANMTVEMLAGMISDFFKMSVGSFDIWHNTSHTGTGGSFFPPSVEDYMPDDSNSAMPLYIVNGSAANEGFTYSGTSTGGITLNPFVNENLNYMRAYAVPILGDGLIDTVTVTAGGHGYTEPTARITDPTGYGAEMALDVTNGVITGARMITRGRDYTNPTVVIEDTSGTGGAISVTLGNGKILAVRVIDSGAGYASNLGPITIHGTHTTPAVFQPIVDNGAIKAFSVVDKGAGYTTDAYITLPKNGSYVRLETYFYASVHGTSFSLDFQFDIFKACGVPASKVKDYKINIFTGLTKIFDWYYTASGNSGYAGVPLRYTVNMTPAWTSVNDTNYGIFNVHIGLYGAAGYYANAVGISWVGQLTKYRNF